ncbi:replication protein A 70 kDa DNA-binding subunit C-like [Pyrus ussuriensis x Pyrus communis]|uniref:Replication protein A 70 kDa DNA-binding subunit C-like n=1 Tax=Pyrus ussuriensis x Pyrus communis TaxID=2448454 RepID=A0A5N5FFT9_9ROSA|nr:replication protein A 70 kDa DNA-binding subunit C-like [Pyrus ussuriensis x Pyrus communis]
MEDEGPTLLDQLVAYKKVVKIKYPSMGDRYTGLHCILVDEKASVFPPIPQHKFFLQEYNRLYPRLKKLDILTDVIGPLIAVQPLEPIQINQRIDHKCDLVIQNIRSFRGKITLWLDVAHAFSALSLLQLPQPIVVVFTSLRVKLTSSTLFFIDPDIPEFNTYKSVTIEDLGYLDPDLYKVYEMFFFLGTSVKRYNTRNEWWYTACPTCATQMYKYPTMLLVLEDETDEINTLIIGISGENVFGIPCKDLVFNQRSADQKQLPSEFLRLIGQKKKKNLPSIWK